MTRYYTNKTPHNTYRLFLEDYNNPVELINNLNQLSIWGGPDSIGDNYSSWEFSEKSLCLSIQFSLEMFGYKQDYSFIT